MAKYKYQYQIDGDNLGNSHRRAIAKFNTLKEAKNYILWNGYLCYDYDIADRGYIYGFGACKINKRRVYI